MAILRSDFLRTNEKKFNYGKYIHLKRYEYAYKKIKGNVLDVGCGFGYGTSILSKSTRIQRVYGIDICQETIKYAKDIYENNNCKFINGNIERLPFPNNTFDYIISFENIEHVENYNYALNEIKRTLKPNGILILSTPNNRDLLVRYLKYSGKLKKWPEKYQPNEHHIKEFYFKEIVEILRQKGLLPIGSFGQVLRVPKINSRKDKRIFEFFEKIARLLPKYSLIMVFNLQNKKAGS